MEKLPMCRICLAENVSMYIVVNRNLHDLYEKLTGIPFVTEDSRPMLACFFCCAKLKQCYRLLRQCLEAEELFAQMMDEDYEPNALINQDHLESFCGFIKCPIVHISIVDECQTESIAIKEELPAVCDGLDDIIEPKEEYQSDELEPENLDYSYLDVPPHHSESDLEDDVPLMEFKTKVEEEQEVSKKKRRARETTSKLSSGHYDVCHPVEHDNINASNTPERQIEFMKQEENSLLMAGPVKRKQGRPKTSDKTRQEQLREACRRYKKAHPDRIKRYAAEHREYQRAAVKRYREKNREAHRMSLKRYQEKNPEVHRKAAKRYRDKKKMERKMGLAIEVKT